VGGSSQLVRGGKNEQLVLYYLGEDFTTRPRCSQNRGGNRVITRTIARGRTLTSVAWTGGGGGSSSLTRLKNKRHTKEEEEKIRM